MHYLISEAKLHTVSNDIVCMVVHLVTTCIVRADHIIIQDTRTGNFKPQQYGDYSFEQRAVA